MRRKRKVKKGDETKVKYATHGRHKTQFMISGAVGAGPGGMPMKVHYHESPRTVLSHKQKNTGSSKWRLPLCRQGGAAERTAEENSTRARIDTSDPLKPWGWFQDDPKESISFAAASELASRFVDVRGVTNITGKAASAFAHQPESIEIFILILMASNSPDSPFTFRTQ